MAGEVQDNVPLPKFNFLVQFGDDLSASFQEVGGLDNETIQIGYRHGNSPIFYPIKMPGLGRVGNVTMRKGIFAGDAGWFTWRDEINTNSARRQTVVIRLRDENGAAKMVWTLRNAFPTKITGTELKSEGNEVAVESVEIAFETLEVSTP